MHGSSWRRLMAVELANVFFTVHCRKIRTYPRRHGRKLGVARRDMAHGGEYLPSAIPLGELFDDLADTRNRYRIACTPYCQRLRHIVPRTNSPFVRLS